MIWDPFILVDMLILVLALTMLAYTIGLIVKTPEKWLMIFPLTFWAGHLAFFYGFVVVGNMIGYPMIDDAFIIWSTVQRLHGVITMFYMTWIVSHSTFSCGKK